MARKHRLTAVAAALALAATAPAAAHAATCVTGRTPDVVFDGVVLSGPRLDITGDLLSPARMQVFRYLKGRGPRVVRVATSFRQGASGLHAFAGTFTPEPGEVYRIYGQTPRGAGSSAARGVLEPALCGGFRIESPRRWLHPIRGTVIRAGSLQGGAPWKAEPLSGPHGLRCIRFQPANEPTGTDRQAECAARSHRRTLLVGVATTSQGPSTTTAVVVAGTKLRRVEMATPDGEQRLNVLGRDLPAAVAVFRGFVDPTELEVTATLAGGRRAEIELASRRADAPDPTGPAGWAAYGQDTWPQPHRGMCASFWQLMPDFRDVGGSPLTAGACGSFGRRGFWFAIRTAAAAPPPATRTVVTGAIGPKVRAVTVAAGGKSYPVGIARFGRAFIAVLPQGTAAAQVTVAFTMFSGAVLSYTGRSDLGLAKVPRGAL